MQRFQRSVWTMAAAVALAACGSSGSTTVDNGNDDDAPTGAPPTTAATYALTDSAYTTLQQAWAPTVPPAATMDEIDAGTLGVTDIARFADAGLGVEVVVGEPWNVYNDLAPGYAAYATTVTASPVTTPSLLYFWQSADQQLTDEESPIRLAGLYAPGTIIGSAYRPQSYVSTQLFESHVRTARRLSDLSGRPYDFAVVTGDLTDGGQLNELRWFIEAMSGGTIDPDSGINDDPVPGPGNDASDPFVSAGIGVPWYAVLGNHETLYIGTATLDDAARQAATGATIFHDGLAEIVPVPEPSRGLSNGYRDASTVYGDVVTQGTLPADPDRRILDMVEVLSMLQEAPGEPAGHGYTAEQAAAGDGDFSLVPVAGKPIRLIGLNTVWRGGDEFELSTGYLTAAQLSWLEDELVAARANNELVIVASHHRSGDMHPQSPVSGDELVAVLGRYDNVVLHVTGHGHYSALVIAEAPAGAVHSAGGYWELMVPSTIDFPPQSRIFELVYEGERYLSIYVTNVDHNAPTDSLAHHGREAAAARRWFQGQDARAVWEERAPERNMILRSRLPQGVAAAIEATSWATTVESRATLAALPAPTP